MRRILIVEENNMQRLKMSEIISAEIPSVKIFTTTSANGCLDVLGDLKPDLVLMDIQMRTDNGLRLIKAITHRCPDVIIVVHSICDNREYRKRAIRAGANHFVSKLNNSIQDLIALLLYYLRTKAKLVKNESL
jgi:DNA-binding NarL/FixJ family response regulator